MAESEINTTPVVDAIGQLHFEGNIIPHTWYKAIVFPNGKTDLNAIVILAEIVYWYRPTVEHDEATGRIISVRKKFRDDMLQRHYRAFADQFGLTVRQCRDAVARLIDGGFIRRELRTVETPQGKMGNVPYFEPVVEVIQRISYHVETSKGSRSNGIGLTPHGETYTKNSRIKTSAKNEGVRPPRGRVSRKSGYSDPPSDAPRKKYSR